MNKLPVRIRLSLVYLAVILVTFTVFSLGTYFTMQQAIEAVVDRQLEERAASMLVLLQQGIANGSLQQGSMPSASLASADELYQVWNENGAAILQAPSMKDMRIGIDAVSSGRHRRQHGSFVTILRRHTHVRVYTTIEQLGVGRYTVQTASSITPLDEVLEQLRHALLLGLPPLFLLAMSAGYWLSGRAMQPVRQITEATNRISDRNLSERLLLPAASDEFRKLAATINDLLERIQAAFQRVTRFTADASHELRTPLTVIRTTAEIALEQERTPEEYRELMQHILTESETTSDLIESLLTLARADTDAQVELSPVCLCSILESVQRASLTSAANRDLILRFSSSTETMMVRGEAIYLRRLFTVLVENAIRYTPSGGHVDVCLKAMGNTARLEVSDDGIGIPEPYRERVFDRFYRAANAREFSAEGSGLGLSIARSIVDAHRGTLSFQPREVRGSTFLVELPLLGSSSPFPGSRA